MWELVSFAGSSSGEELRKSLCIIKEESCFREVVVFSFSIGNVCLFVFYYLLFYNCFVLNRFEEFVCPLSTLQRYGGFVVLKIGIFFNFQGGFCKLLILLFGMGTLFVYWIKWRILWMNYPLCLWFNIGISSLLFIICFCWIRWIFDLLVRVRGSYASWMIYRCFSLGLISTEIHESLCMSYKAHLSYQLIYNGEIHWLYE